MQAWLKIATVSAMMLVATPAAGDTHARSAVGLPAADSRDLTDVARESSGRKVEPDPTDDASIIVECIADRGGETSDEDAPRESLKPRFAELSLATMPRIPLGPSECGFDDERGRWKLMYEDGTNVDNRIAHDLHCSLRAPSGCECTPAEMARGEKSIAAFRAPAARTDFAQDRETHRKIGQTAQAGLHEMQRFVSLPEVLSAQSRLLFDGKRKLS
jgi:hypothetical protein